LHCTFGAAPLRAITGASEQWRRTLLRPYQTCSSHALSLSAASKVALGDEEEQETADRAATPYYQKLCHTGASWCPLLKKIRARREEGG
jgi:hypothetical protein